MNLNGLTPEQRDFILNLNKRLQALEAKLTVLQGKVIKVDPELPGTLVSNIVRYNLN